MKLVREGTWEIKTLIGTEFPFLLIYTSNAGKEVIVPAFDPVTGLLQVGFRTEPQATRAINEIFVQLSNSQQVFIA